MAVYTVRIERQGGDLGFSVKGGREHGIGILVSEVDPRGNARKWRMSDLEILMPLFLSTGVALALDKKINEK